MRNCKLCPYSRVCNPLPGICILAFYVIIAGVIGGITYLFFSQGIG
jgi:hypothetical protein